MFCELRFVLSWSLVFILIIGSGAGVFPATIVASVEAQAESTEAPRPYYSPGPLGSTVDTFEGTFAYTFNSLDIPAGKLPISIFFAYFSRQHNANLGYGPGWQFSYNDFYIANGDGYAVFLGDGSVLSFQRAEDGTFTPVSGMRETWDEIEPGRFALTLPNHLRYEFGDSSHRRVTKITEPNGNALTFDYDEQARQVAMSDGRGRTFAMEYSGSLLTRLYLLDDARYDVRLEYDAQQRLAAIIDQYDSRTGFDYDESNRLSSITNPLGQTATIRYIDGRVVESTFGGVQQLYEYDTSAGITTLHVPLGETEQVTQFAYDDAGRIVELTDPAGGVTRYTWDERGNLTGITDALGRTTTHNYDEANQLIAITSPSGATRTYDYNGNGDLVGTRDPLGQYTTFTYDASHNITGSRDEEGRETTLTYDSQGNPVQVVLPDGMVTEFVYQAGLPQKVTDGLGNTVTLEHDLLGKLVSQVDPLGNYTEFDIDSYSRLQALTDPLGNTLTYSYDAVGNLVREQRASGEAQAYTYDVLGRLTEVTDNAGNVTRYQYDSLGNLIGIVDANGNRQTFTYDVAGQLMAALDALGNQEMWTYDAYGNVTVYTNGNGEATSYTYNADNRLERIAYVDGSNVAFTYDALGRRTSMTDVAGTTRYTYDATGRVTSIETPDNNTVGYRYDAAGRLIELIYPDSGTTSYRYDAAGRLTEIVDAVGTFSFAYDAAGRLIRRELPNGVTTDYEYDDAGRLVALRHSEADTSLIEYEYEFDPDYRRIAEQQTGSADAGSEQYVYDALGRLTEVLKQDGGFERYRYDAVGNRIGMETPDGTTSYSYNAANQLTGLTLPNGETVSFEYDGTGALVQRIQGESITRYAFDAAGNLASVLSNEQAIEYDYNGDGYRVAKTVGGERTGYVLDYSGGLPRVLVEQDADSQQRYVVGPSLQALAGDVSGEAEFHLHDALGSLVGLTGPTGEMLETYTYDSFGVPVTSLVEDTTFGFTGEPYDPEAQLLYLRARYYSPEIGRFISEDGFAGFSINPSSLNHYVYVENNPVNFIDPWGLFGIPIARPFDATVNAIVLGASVGSIKGGLVVAGAVAGAVAVGTLSVPAALVIGGIGAGVLISAGVIGVLYSTSNIIAAARGVEPISLPSGVAQAVFGSNGWTEFIDFGISLAGSGIGRILSIGAPVSLLGNIGNALDDVSIIIGVNDLLGTSGIISYIIGERDPAIYRPLGPQGVSVTDLVTDTITTLDISSPEIDPSTLMYLDTRPEGGALVISGPDATFVTVPASEMLDLIFVFDTTGSMVDDIDAARVQATTIAGEVATRIADQQMAVVTYRDQGDAYRSRVEQNFTPNEQLVVNAIQNITVSGGGDWPESVYSGLMTAIELSWRDGANKKIVLIGDAPPHDPEPGTGLTMADVLEAAYNVDPANIYPILVRSDPEAAAYFQALADGSTGQMFTAANTDEVVDAIMAAIEQIIREQPVTRRTIPRFPPPPPIPACTDMDMIANTVVTTGEPQNSLDSDTVRCRVLSGYGGYTTNNHAGHIGNQEVIDQGILDAVDIFQVDGQGTSHTGFFDEPMRVCLRGQGRLVFLSARQAPRQPAYIDFVYEDGFTCGHIAEPGTVVLVGDSGQFSPASEATEASVGASGACLVTTTVRPNLRAAPAVEGRILKTLPVDATLPVLDWRNGWYRVQDADMAGWVSGEFVTAQNCG